MKYLFHHAENTEKDIYLGEGIFQTEYGDFKTKIFLSIRFDGKESYPHWWVTGYWSLILWVQGRNFPVEGHLYPEGKAGLVITPLSGGGEEQHSQVWTIPFKIPTWLNEEHAVQTPALPGIINRKGNNYEDGNRYMAWPNRESSKISQPSKRELQNISFGG